MSIFMFLDLIGLGICLIICDRIIVRGVKYIPTRVWLGLVLSLFVWNFGMFFVHNPLISPKHLLLILSITSLGWFFFPYFLLLSGITYLLLLKGKREKSFFPSLPLGLLSLFFLYFQLKGELVNDFIPSFWGWNFLWKGSFWRNLYIAYCLIFVGTGSLLNIYSIQHDPLLKNKRVGIVSISGIVLFFFIFLFDVFLHLKGIVNFLLSLSLIGVYSTVMTGYSYPLKRKEMDDRVISAISEILIILNGKAMITRINKTGLDILGYQEKDILGKSVEFLFPEENKFVEGVPIKALISRCELRNIQVYWRTKGGRKIPFLLNSSLVRDDRGNITAIVCTARNISEKQQVEDEIRKSQEYLRMLFDYAPDAYYLTDIRGNIIDTNKTVEKLSGYTKEEVVSRNVLHSNFFLPEDIPKFTRILAKSSLGKFTAPEEFTLLCKDGRHFNVELRAYPVKLGDEFIVLCIARDISDRKAAEERLKEVQFQLIQAEKMQSIGRLASGVAHEVKNPLGIILMGIDYLTRHITTTDTLIHATLKDMREAARRADAIIKGLLDFASLSKVVVSPYDLNAVVENALLLVKHYCDKYHITLEKDLKKDIPYVIIDRNRIEQVLINLLMNGIQAMGKRGRLCVRTYTKKFVEEVKDFEGKVLFSPGDTAVVVEIEDAGPGIPEDILDKIFEPFFTTKRTHGGTGLGLAIVKSIIDMHGAYISIDNKKEGSGVIVKIMFKV